MKSLGLVVVLLFSVGSNVFASGVVNQAESSGLAIHGYDPVAYFEQGKAIPGDKSIIYEHEGVSWSFSSEKNRDLFAANADQFVPQYGGYCSFAASRGYVADADPTAWQIVNGKLYLNYNNRVHRKWANNISENIIAGDKNWPGLAKDLE